MGASKGPFVHHLARMLSMWAVVAQVGVLTRPSPFTTSDASAQLEWATVAKYCSDTCECPNASSFLHFGHEGFIGISLFKYK